MTDRPLANFESAQRAVIDTALDMMEREIAALGDGAWINNALWRVQQTKHAIANHFEGAGND